jgi:general secretion pathway protein E/type IV pilus assembly protein PilB
VSLGEILITKGLVTREQVAQANASRRSAADRLDRILLQLGFLSEEDLLKVFSEQFAIPIVDLTNETINSDLLKDMPARLIHRRKIFPYTKRGQTLITAICDPYEVQAVDELHSVTGMNVEPVLATEHEIANMIKRYFGVGGEAVDEMLEGERHELQSLDDLAAEDKDLVQQAQEATVVKLVNEILREAINDRASDIHIEPFEDDLRIRYRIDGVLHTTSMPPQIKRFQPAIVSRIKIMSQLNIAEKRLPQDGAFKIRHEGRDIDIRVSVLPSVYGEGIVLRILDKSSVLLRMTDLGMDGETYDRFITLIERPHGIILVTGPTGSGKTTTLYSALNSIVSDQVKVITVEDPVEYRLRGVNQIQVHPNIGLTFAAGLRSILRHDPDIIMIGEIRDLETAEAAIQASLTGHLVFSTLHTNDACSAATRLIDMGVEPYLVASAVEGVMAQRLVRSICPNCREPYHPKPEDLPGDFEMEKGKVLYHGVGCRTCKNSGLKGRLGLFELAPFSDTLRQAIMERATAGTLNDIARKEKMITLREDGWRKVRNGLTTPEEVQRVTVTSML